MSSTKTDQHISPPITSLADYLPGLAPPDGSAEAPGHQPDSPGPGWWIKRSDRQGMNPAGQPIGYRHHLMHGRQSVISGVGADCSRTFRQQAEFLNTRNQHATRRSDGAADATSSPQPHSLTNNGAINRHF